MSFDTAYRKNFEEAYEQGSELIMINQIRKKLAKSYNIAQIAEDLEETEDNIQILIEAYDLD